MYKREHGKAHMGLGLAALGRPGYINLGHAEDLGGEYKPEAMRARAYAVLDAALEAGVRYFDTARSYGRAEEFLGSWLRDRKAKSEFPEVFIASKWGYTYTADWKVKADKHEVKDHSLDTLNRQWPETREHLGGAVGLYQIHSATLETGVLENQAVLDRLQAVKSEGVEIGLSLSGPTQGDVLRKALEVRVDHAPLFDAVQATYNLLERAAGPALQEAHAAGLRVIIKEGVANGRLTERNEFTEDRHWMEILREIAQSMQASVDAVALAFVMAEPWTDVVLSGAATTEHLASNLKSLSLNIDQTTRSALDTLTMKSGEYWALRSGLAWQ